MSPYRLIRPYVGFRPTTPQRRAGCRTTAAGVGAERPDGLTGRHRGGGAAARPARHAFEIPRVVHGPVRRVLVGGAHRELVAVGLADEHRAGAGEPGPRGRVVGRDVGLEDLRPAGRADAVRGEDVLERDGDARDGRLRRAGGEVDVELLGALGGELGASASGTPARRRRPRRSARARRRGLRRRRPRRAQARRQLEPHRDRRARCSRAGLRDPRHAEAVAVALWARCAAPRRPAARARARPRGRRSPEGSARRWARRRRPPPRRPARRARGSGRAGPRAAPSPSSVSCRRASRRDVLDIDLDRHGAQSSRGPSRPVRPSGSARHVGPTPAERRKRRTTEGGLRRVDPPDHHDRERCRERPRARRTPGSRARSRAPAS